MKLGRLVENEDARRVQWGAAAAALLGLMTVINGALTFSLGLIPAGFLLCVFGAVQLGLAFGIYRRSRTCAIVVLVLFVIERLIAFLFVGLAMMGIIWTAIIGAMLWNGLKSILAERDRSVQHTAAA